MTTFEALKKLNENPELAAKTKAECKTPERIFEVLQSLGLTDDFETFKKAAAEINNSTSKLDEKDVDAIVAADGMTTLTTTTTASIAGAAGVAAM